MEAGVRINLRGLRLQVPVPKAQGLPRGSLYLRSEVRLLGAPEPAACVVLEPSEQSQVEGWSCQPPSLLPPALSRPWASIQDAGWR